MSSHGLLNCYQHHAFQQHFSGVPNTFTAKPLQQTPPKHLKLTPNLSLNIGIKFNLTIKKRKNDSAYASIV